MELKLPPSDLTTLPALLASSKEATTPFPSSTPNDTLSNPTFELIPPSKSSAPSLTDVEFAKELELPALALATITTLAPLILAVSLEDVSSPPRTVPPTILAKLDLATAKEIASSPLLFAMITTLAPMTLVPLVLVADSLPKTVTIRMFAPLTHATAKEIASTLPGLATMAIPVPMIPV